MRNEFSYDHWIPGYQQVYKLTDVLRSPGQPAMSSDRTRSMAWCEADFEGMNEHSMTTEWRD